MDDTDFGEPEPGKQREGLPPGYRMRADSHYVEQLTSRVPLPQLRAIPIREIDGAPAMTLDEFHPLVRSVTRFGVLQPLLVRSRGSRFELIAGARRIAAAAAAGLTDVPCLVYTCDDARARALAEADNVRVEPEAGPAPPVPADVPVSALGELRQSFGTIESCLLLLAERDTTLRDRVALDLIRTEAHRASRLVRCLSVITSDPTLSLAPLSLRSALDQVIEAFGPERRLSGVAVHTDIGDGPHLVSADADWLAVGLSGAIGGMMGLVQSSRTPALTVRLTTAASRTSVALEISQDAVSVPARSLARLFDAGWTDRPGGFQASVELAAARRMSELHRGTAEALPGDRGGCRIVLITPALA